MEELSVIVPDKSKQKAVIESEINGAFTSSGTLLRAYSYALNQFIVHQLGGNPFISLTDELRLTELFNHLGDPDTRDLIRVRKVNHGFAAFLPCAKDIPSLGNIYHEPSFYTLEALKTLKTIESVIPDIWNLEKPIDMSLGNLLKGFSEVMNELPDTDPESNEECEKAIRGFRLVATPGLKAFNNSYLADKTRKDFIDGNLKDMPDSQLREAMTRAWSSRQFTLFAEYFLSDDMVEYVTQERGDNIKRSQIVEYVSRIQATRFQPRTYDTYSSHIISVSKIAEDNRATGVKLEPQTNQDNLSVTEKGIITWLPKKNVDPMFVEAAIEEGGDQPDGDWTKYDAVDPESNEFVTDTSTDGRQVRKLKPRGRNLLMYVDWWHGKLAYTGEKANVRIRDISMFRPVQANNIATYLKAPLKDSNSISASITKAMSFGVDYGKRNGIELNRSTEFTDPYISVEVNTIALHEFNEKNVWGAIREILSSAIRVHNGRHSGVTGQELTPEQYRPLHEWVESISADVSMTIVSANSPIGFLRSLHDFYTRVIAKVEENPDSAFGGSLGVTSMLDTIGALQVLVRYGSKVAEIEKLDLEERKPYINPDLDPINDIEVPKIPYVSGKLEFMPHQVKVWNYLKNHPKNTVLAVDAGGGKTILGLTYAAELIGSGEVKRPLIICPGMLVSNYINDALMAFDGKVNIVNISSAVIADKRWGEDRLLQLCQGAPINTIFVTDYDFVAPKGNSTRLSTFVYGNTSVTVSLNAELLKRVPWDMVILDESHFLKTHNGNRNREVMRLLASVKYKVQMSGTYISDNLTDVVGEFALLHPQTFGDTDSFLDTYFINGDKGTPNPDAQRKIREAMEQNSSFIHVSRKEWAALLPKRTDTFYAVEMTKAQKMVYDAILMETKDEFNRQLTENPILKNAFAKRANEPADPDNEVDEENKDNPELEDEENSPDGDDNSIDSLLDGPLNFYLARLEGFLTAPASDPLGKSLTGPDAISPKVAKTVQIIREHFAKKVPGKIIVWTQYIESASSLYEALPPELKKQALHYVASNGPQILSEFTTNPAKTIMVGCEKSINTGQNLQIASHIIREETVWNWGTLEQGESRINRPARNDPRKEENGGQGIFYSWVFCNMSLDVSKNSRMFSKLIATVKFYNSKNPDYMDIDVPPPLRLTKENIFAKNDWQDRENGCREFFEAYEQYQQVQEREYTTFRDSPDCREEGYTMEKGKVLPGSGFLINIPYTPRMNLFAADKLGLVPFMEYVSTIKHKGRFLWESETWSPKDLFVHTEYGDCVAVDYNRARSGKPSTLRVVVPDGTRASVPLSACWVITKPTVNGLDIRSMIAKQVGAKDEKVVPTTKEHIPDVGRGVPKKGGSRLPEKDPKGMRGGFEIFVSSYDNHPAIAIDGTNPHVQEQLPELEKRFGFARALPYYDSNVLTVKTLRRWVAAVEDHGLVIAKAYKDLLEQDMQLWEKHKDIQKFLFGLAKGQRPNFFREQMKAAKPGVIKPYLYISGGKWVYLCLNAKTNAASISKVKGIQIPGIKWNPAPIKNEVIAFFKSKPDLQAALKGLFADFAIENKVEAIKDFNAMRVSTKTITQ